VLALLVGAAISVELSDEQQWQSWMKKYQKSYDTTDEYNRRLLIFKHNLKRYAALNLHDDHVVHGPTQFSDLTHQEFKDLYLMKNFTGMTNSERPMLPLSLSPPGGYPTSYSWVSKGATTGVYNQGQCGSCWAFSTTESIESQCALAGKGLKSLSMQQIVDCDTTDHGCNGGNPPTAYEYVMRAGGLDTYASYPYTGRDGACTFKPADVGEKISSWGYVTTTRNEDQMLAYTATKGPPSVCVDASNWDSYNGGVYTSSNCGRALDHCVQIVGWTVADGMTAWVVRNSWGTSWGYGGYLYVAMGEDACGIAQECTAAVC
jgi:cathepsin F